MCTLLLYLKRVPGSDPIVLATILHQMGLQHERLTYRHAGRDWRLTDVHGRVLNDLLA